jgi:hypothetical protein
MKNLKIPIFLYVLGAGILSDSTAFASPCCAGSSATPALMSGDERIQMSLLTSRSTVIGDAPAHGIPVFRSASDDEVTLTHRLDAAVLLDDRWQVGFILPVVQHSVRNHQVNETHTAPGDLRFNLGYEALPEWTYSEWKPKGYVFTQLLLPTGRSIHETTMLSAADASGSGFFTAALGTLLIKRWSSWDAQLLPEVHYSFARRFQAGTLQVTPGWGMSFTLAGGYSIGPFRVGFRLQPLLNQAQHFEFFSDDLVRTASTARRLLWTTGTELTYLHSDHWSMSATYTDQTLLGPAYNTTLSRSLALAVQRRWMR